MDRDSPDRSGVFTPATRSGVFFCGLGQVVEIIRSPQDMQDQALKWRTAGQRIVLVPTMGFFHQGHLSLMEYGRTVGDRLVVSLFVNPTQFGPNEDLEQYPRDEARDCELARQVGVDVLFAPEPQSMYPPGYQTYVTVEQLTQGLCGAFRPTHFRGVTTVVLKLFNLVQPHIAVFGEKDYQQLVTIQRMVVDLNLPLAVVGRPIVREPDGLAMSSRNRYLTLEERQSALCLYKAGRGAQELVANGEVRRDRLMATVSQMLNHSPGTVVDYVSLVEPSTLAEVDIIQGAARLAMAVRIGRTRLIDNFLLEESRS
ncbi:MAG: pantoate--beta-alanine ligase [Deltaproteobacteria bacterium]|nr:pantoate--beta-alanine ligase [Deltaproteobacteria bacterium]MBW1952495.1 pantoate--beta-alanine ligase [Deltaproteobacteria bacterium]MBW1987546.1 pantoate--beta-alanine ligase [Deltaproteobacteria bacterium]